MARHAVPPAEEPILSRAKRAALLVLGTVMVALGLVGIILPVLPTTCFLLGAAACYGRSSERFYQWLFTNRLFGEYLRTYRDERAMPGRIKYGSMALLWISIGISALFFVEALWLQILLVGIAVAVTAHVASLRTLRRA
jgi:uncharacterized membrane protein YbaN (DUF454 family)